MSKASLIHRTARNFIAVLLIFPALVAWPQDTDFGIETSLPITLNADSSEFDRRNDKLLFRGLHITQGVLEIQADEGRASRLDFENSLWEFSGNVIINGEGTIAYCDEAEITFKDHELKNAVMHGAPARFEQVQQDDGSLTQGHANTMEYDLVTSVISMIDDAWLSDGANEVSGARISYDLTREYIIADADDDGQIRMKINPPEKEQSEGSID